MAITNPVFNQLVKAITPVISIGVGSAICTVCSQQKLSPDKLEKKDLPALRMALVQYYEKFWSNQLTSIRAALEGVQ